MEEAELEDLPKDGARPVSGDRPSIQPQGLDRCDIGDLDSFDEIGHQDPGGRVFPVHVVGEVLAEAFDSLCFDHEIELPTNRARELTDQLVRPKHPELRNMPLDETGDLFENRNVGLDLTVDMRALDLDGHFRAVLQRRPVNLGD